MPRSHRTTLREYEKASVIIERSRKGANELNLDSTRPAKTIASFDNREWGFDNQWAKEELELSKINLVKLTDFPLEICDFYHLNKLELGNNRLTEIPTEIGKLINLKILDLSNNFISSLPFEITQLTKLEYLNLKGNQLSIPPEILGKTDEPTTILNYYFKHLTGRKKPLNEAKMLVVGQGGVGKTSLIKRLLIDDFDKHQQKTDGIDIQPWQITIDANSLQVNVWDLGGQEIMHSTHQFFLTKRSIYLLILDSRLGEEENRVEYWLKMIQSFGGESPVIVVGNKIDQSSLDLDRRGLQLKYPQIKAIVETSCETGAGINKLRSILITEIGLLEHIRDQILLTWFEVKTHLEQMEKDYIPYSSYIELCQSKGIIDDKSQQTLVGFLHDLGVVLNFQDEPRLEDTHILNPEWITNGVYQILNYPALQSNGVLETRMLNQILPGQKYPKGKYLFIVDMMRKFELCFDFEGLRDEKFLIPDLLAKEELDTHDWSDSLTFQYHYNILLNSVISRFIVRMHTCIHRDTYWRNGVVLEREGNLALIKADKEERKIYIYISGLENTRREMLGIIRSQFEAIHKTFSGLVAAGKVPLPHHPEIIVDYSYLRKLERLGHQSFIPEGPYEDEVLVRKLLDGVDAPVQATHIVINNITNIIDTKGGTMIGGSVNTGRDFVGRDKEENPT